MRWLAALLAVIAAPAMAVECSGTEYLGDRFTVCEVDMARDDLRLFLRDGTGAVLGDFDAVARASGRDLAFAMNAGMYHEDRDPVGLYVEEGREIAPLVTREGPGNFGLLPNGVFCIGQGHALVIESRAYARAMPRCRFATQSGPMLVIDGELHPRFLADGTSRYIRNGVGTSADGARAVFVISENPVTFHEFGSFFRDVLRLPQALYLDGSVSRLHDAGSGRSDRGRRMGPIVGVLE